MAESYNRYRSMAQEASTEKEQTPQQRSQPDNQESYNKYRRMAQEALSAKEAKQESAAEKRNKWTGKEVGKMGLGIAGGGAALGFFSVNHITKFLLRKVKGAGDFVNSWEWMEQTILGTKQRA